MNGTAREILDGDDPRPVLILAVCLTTLAAAYSGPIASLVFSALAAVCAWMAGVNLRKVLARAAKLVPIIAGLMVVQSVFGPEPSPGTPALWVGRAHLLTSHGLAASVSVAARFWTVISSSMMVARIDQKRLIMGLAGLGLPYEIGFAVSMAARFMPLAYEDLNDAVTAVQMRGLDLARVPVWRRFGTYAAILVPVLRATIVRAQRVATTMEARAWGAMEGRTALRRLRWSRPGAAFSALAGAVTLVLLAAKVTVLRGA